jgi:hypothetical protein
MRATIGIGLLGIVALVEPLSAASSTWRCEFPGFDEPLTFIDLGNGAGKIIGNAGSADLWVIPGELGVSFVEPVASGAVMTTTTKTKTGEAVHSRNTIMTMPELTLKPSQAVGRCRPWN